MVTLFDDSVTCTVFLEQLEAGRGLEVDLLRPGVVVLAVLRQTSHGLRGGCGLPALAAVEGDLNRPAVRQIDVGQADVHSTLIVQVGPCGQHREGSIVAGDVLALESILDRPTYPLLSGWR